MHTTEIQELKLIGLALKSKTTNLNGQSSTDCGNLWQRFESEGYASRIPGKLSEEIFAVYHQYEGDHTQPFSYFIGCKVHPETKVPEGMDQLIIPGGEYQKITARGEMPACIANAWKEIWDSSMKRAYTVDFEIYDDRSTDWNNAEVDIYVSTH